MICETKILNPLKIPLQGIQLIESSAGTGKTYTITIIYLRLLLGIGNKNNKIRPLNIKEILVVTFTKIIAEELRNKIKKQIHQFKLACINKYSDNILFSQLLIQINNIDDAIIKLSEAEQNINEASIYTIHGFCKNILSTFPLETNTLINYSIIENESHIQQQMCLDFWRKNFYPLPQEIINIIQKYWNNPKKFIQEILPYIQNQLPIIYYPFYHQNDDIISHHNKIIHLIKNIKKQWIISKYNIKELLYPIINNNLLKNKKQLNWFINIDEWSNTITIDYNIPKELKFFYQTLIKEFPNKNDKEINILFKKLNILYQYSPSLKSYIFMKAIHEIRNMIVKEKQIKLQLSFDDLINNVYIALHNYKNNMIINLIRTLYPIAIIDEFQDVNKQQYDIFNKIYVNQPNNGLILIGDPKQLIYSFRGANIFNYMQISKNIKIKYTINTNWRSSSKLINSINQIFQNKKSSFIFNEILFIPNKSSNYNDTLKLIINNKIEPAIYTWMPSNKVLTTNQYQEIITEQHAIFIKNLLNNIHSKNAWIEKKTIRKPLQTSDITILVRNQHEANIINATFKKFKIPTIYFSNKNNIFDTSEAKELLSLLQSILFLEDKSNISKILTNNLLNITSLDIYHINNNEYLWNNLITKFSNYRACWKKNGILTMLHQIIKDYKIITKEKYEHNNYTQFINLIHLGELLQTISFKLYDQYKLIAWLKLQITQPDYNNIKQQIRLSNNTNQIKIISIHKSKGLEFPIVFLPFITNFHKQKHILFHNRETSELHLDLTENKNHYKLACEERLAEDIRILYVAMTRAIYQCHIGIGITTCKHDKSINNKELHHSGIEYLLQQDIICNNISLQKELNLIILKSKGNIKFQQNISLQKQYAIEETKYKKIFNKTYKTLHTQNTWKVTSYTELNKTHTNQHVNKINKIQEININIDNTTELTQHNFPKGNISGIFLHNLLANINFNKNLEDQQLQIYMKKNNINNIWLSILKKWIINIINTPLNNNNLKLKHLTNNNICTELKFYLPMNTIKTASTINKLCKYYDPLSKCCPSITLPKIKGMLKGSIDLFFHWDNKYYLLDYKSNWLGPEFIDYSIKKLKQEIIIHRYELQYQLYTLALHRFLKHKLISYDYQKDFGGIFYLFLRGINIQQKNNSIFFCCPKKELIYGLDEIFNGKKINI